MHSTTTLLIEFLTEELPPLNLEQNFGKAFAEGLSTGLSNFMAETSQITSFVTPRRFGAIITHVATKEANRQLRRKGPTVALGVNDGVPSKALLGFMRSCDISRLEQLEQGHDGYFHATQLIAGRELGDSLHEIITNALKNLVITKNMRWGNHDFSFARPVHNLVIMADDKLITLSQPILGLTAVNYTYGHRTMGCGKIIIENAANYVNQLELEGMVIANPEKRKDLIINGLNHLAQQLNLDLNHDEELVNEVSALVEYPTVLAGEFAKDFLAIPKECLILSMAKHQKYFALLDKTTRQLSNKFLFVANLNSNNPQTIINGNQKVLAARLSDAKFFFDTDTKHQLGYFIERLSSTVYHGLLGTQGARIERLKYIAAHIAKLTAIEPQLAVHTASIMKADLASEMVLEFPELQGIMGKHYALCHGEEITTATAIEQHYYPRFSEDKLPQSMLAITSALTDKLEILVGIWGTGQIPSGDKDPFGLRRASLGIVRILLQHHLDVKELLAITESSFPPNLLNFDTITQVYQFILQRLHYFLTNSNAYSYPSNVVQSVCGVNPSYFDYIPSILNHLYQFATNQTNQMIFSANKRIDNILKRNASSNYDDSGGSGAGGDNCDNSSNSSSNCSDNINAKLFTHECEHQLFNLLNQQITVADACAQKNDWGGYFEALTQFNLPINAFFDNIMVMDENIALRNNRIALLRQLYQFMNKYCRLADL